MGRSRRYSGPQAACGQLHMTERDADIEFDFWEEPETDQTQTIERGPRRGGRPPEPPGSGGGESRRPSGPGGPGGAAPLLRLIGLIAFAILIVVLLVFWVQSCRDSGKKNAYKGYLDKMGAVGRDSQSVGRDFADVLTTPGVKFSDISQRLPGLITRQRGDVTRAQALSPPGPLRLEQQHAVEALEFRVSGLQGLQSALNRASTSKTGNDASLLAQQASRLTTSDVIWDDLFFTPTVLELQNQGIRGVSPTDSNFVQLPDFDSVRSWQDILDRLRGSTTTTGLHGTGLVVTRALPSGKELSTDTDNTIVASQDLGFAVTVEDTGDSQEVRVEVTLTIQQSPSPITKKQIIDVINAGQQKTVTFTNLGAVQFATKTTVKVDVKAVPGEANLDNNSAQYPVIFSVA
jgi:hypothetical protein